MQQIRKITECTEILPETRRKLILVTKVVQGIANENIEFNESYMNQINDLLQEYTIKLHKFYDRLNVGGQISIWWERAVKLT